MVLRTIDISELKADENMKDKDSITVAEKIF